MSFVSEDIWLSWCFDRSDLPEDLTSKQLAVGIFRVRLRAHFPQASLSIEWYLNDTCHRYCAYIEQGNYLTWPFTQVTNQLSFWSVRSSRGSHVETVGGRRLPSASTSTISPDLFVFHPGDREHVRMQRCEDGTKRRYDEATMRGCDDAMRRCCDAAMRRCGDAAMRCDDVVMRGVEGAVGMREVIWGGEKSSRELRRGCEVWRVCEGEEGRGLSFY